MRQFGRQYSLKIGNDQESVEINHLRLSFTASKTISSEPNSATIQIYNLNESHRNLLTSKQYHRVSLAVGYAELETIYTGDIIECVINRDDLDWMIELSCGDGYEAYTNSHINLTLNAGATDSDVLNQTMQGMKGVQAGSIDLPKERALPRGKVITGDARRTVNKIAKNQGADWSIQDNHLVVIPKDKVINNEGYELSQETGMIGSPEKTDNGIKVTCLLNPALRIGGLVRIKSIIKAVEGDYKITELHHSGDNLSDDWQTEILCVNGQFGGKQ